MARASSVANFGQILDYFVLSPNLRPFVCNYSLAPDWNSVYMEHLQFCSDGFFSVVFYICRNSDMVGEI